VPGTGRVYRLALGQLTPCLMEKDDGRPSRTPAFWSRPEISESGPDTASRPRGNIPWMKAFGLVAVAFAAAWFAAAAAQTREGFTGSFKDPAIEYGSRPLTDAVTRLDRQLADGSTRLAFDQTRGYLPALLQAFSLPVESQVTVYSQGSLQAPLISMHNPRAIYFNDHLAVGWVRGADVLEIASQDPAQGVVFYSLEQKESARPRFARPSECLRCHVAWETLAIPGFVVLSTGPDDAAGYATGGAVDDRDEIRKRWGGWFITGRRVPTVNLGTAITAPPWLTAKFDTSGFLSPHSDVVALMVLEHQARAMNLITYLGWEARIGASDARIDAIVRELVSYFTFADEAPLAGPVQGSSDFAVRFAASGRRDSKGRSLRDLDLVRHLMRYRCSYMIETAAFAALPARARNAVAAHLTAALKDRDPAALEIVKATTPKLFE
jgi:hypothetical protein